jgi:N-acetylglucosaminyldiphosphoundecaprenol N-acetyl-beta-D-mannosaminyltransferase
LRVAGIFSPPFHPLSEEEDRKIVSLIKNADPDIIWVGLSTPKQEIWMSEHIDRLGNCVLIGVGAAFDFLSGNKKQAPSWMQRIGLEWFFRLSTEPKRLWKRYLINNPLFLILVISQATGLKKYSLDYS